MTPPTHPPRERANEPTNRRSAGRSKCPYPGESILILPPYAGKLKQRESVAFSLYRRNRVLRNLPVEIEFIRKADAPAAVICGDDRESIVALVDVRDDSGAVDSAHKTAPSQIGPIGRERVRLSEHSRHIVAKRTGTGHDREERCVSRFPPERRFRWKI